MTSLQTRKFSARIASFFLILHGLVEIAGLLFINSIPFGLISFDGLTGAALGRNSSAIAMFGASPHISAVCVVGRCENRCLILKKRQTRSAE